MAFPVKAVMPCGVGERVPQNLPWYRVTFALKAFQLYLVKGTGESDN